MNPLHLLMLSPISLAIAGCDGGSSSSPTPETPQTPVDERPQPPVVEPPVVEPPVVVNPAHTTMALNPEWSAPDPDTGFRTLTVNVLLTNDGDEDDAGVRIVAQQALNPVAEYWIGPSLVTIDVAALSVRQVAFVFRNGVGPFWVQINVSRADLTVIHQELEPTQFFPPSNG